MSTLDIVLVVPGLEVDPPCWWDRAIGGSETAGLSMASALAAIGHRVTVFCNLRQAQRREGVAYAPLGQYERYVATFPHDVLIVQRTPQALSLRTASRLNILWLHDLPTPECITEVRGILGNLDRILVLSAFHRERFLQLLPEAEPLVHVTRNGLDLLHFEGVEQHADDELIFGARPERGLDVLLEQVMPRVWAERPDVGLSLCAYENDEGALRPFYARIDALIARHVQAGRRITRLGALGKPALARAYERASLYAYPGPSAVAAGFAEVSCISVMECMAAGLPVVASARGALPETLAPGAGVLVPGDARDEATAARFAAEIVALLADRDRRTQMGAAGRERARELGWDRLAADWTERCWAWIDAGNDDPERLVQHLVEQSDIVPARAVVQAMPPGGARDRLRGELEEGPWRFAFDGTWQAQYEEQVAVPFSAERVRAEPRHQWLVSQLDARPHLRRILDVGCHTGEFQIEANNQLVRHGRPPREWLGVDLSASIVEAARATARDHALAPEAHRFTQGEAPPPGERFDALVAFEVLEHVAEPWRVLGNLEHLLTPEGEVFITVPSGPWEALSYDTSPGRYHVWHLDRHDLEDMVGHKPDVRITYRSAGASKRDDSPLGWWFVRYRVGDEPVRPIDLARHLRLQRPRESLSTVLMASAGDEATLHWCLRSLVPIADQIVLVDNGMSEEGLRIARQYDVELVDGLDPRAHGFSVPRNLGLARARCDWVLWLDPDERLVEGASLAYYLRRNLYDAYAIKQLNFNSDGSADHETPARLFRNNGRRRDGRAIQFHGLVHEQPEVAMNEGPGHTALIPDVFIAHVGYLGDETRATKFQRNAALLARDRAEHPERVVGAALKLRDNQQLATMMLKESGGVLGADARTLCEETVELFSTAFLGKQLDRERFEKVRADALASYSSALEMLGRGFELSWEASVRGGEAQAVRQRARFQSLEEARAAIGWSMTRGGLA